MDRFWESRTTVPILRSVQSVLLAAQKTQVAKGTLLEKFCIYFPFYIHVMLPLFFVMSWVYFFSLEGGGMGQLCIKNSPKWNSLVGKIGTSHDYFHSYYFPVEKCTWLCLLAANVVCVWVIAMPKYHVMYDLDGDQSGIIWLELLLFCTNYC